MMICFPSSENTQNLTKDEKRIEASLFYYTAQTVVLETTLRVILVECIFLPTEHTLFGLW